MTPDARESAGPGRILLWGLWFGLATGLAEAAALTLHHRLIHGFIYLSPNVVWMAPVTEAVLFLFPAVVLAGAAALRRRPVSTRLLLGINLFLGSLAVLFLFSRLYRPAALVLALGIGVQGGRWLDRHREWIAVLIRRTAPLLGGVVLLLAGLVIGGSAWREYRGRRNLPPATAGRPNILLLVLDTVRRADLGLYGYARPTTPALRAWARRGVRFDHAFATSAWTLPSHAGMFTGRLPHELSAGWLRPLDAAYPTVAERLGAHGYETAGFVANALYCNRSFGLGRGFLHYDDYGISPGEFVVNASLSRVLSESRVVRRLTGDYDILARRSAATIDSRFLRWLGARGDSTRPFFAFLNYLDAHQPYFPPAPFDTLFGATSGRALGLLEHRPHMGKIDDAARRLSPEQVEREHRAYDGAIASLDREIDRLLDRLDHRGLLSNTVVIIVSDHGEQFMEHGLFDHGNSLYRYLTEVPLIMLGPGLPAGAVVPGPVSLADLPATIFDLTGVPGDSFPGRSLARVARSGGAGGDRPVFSETSGPGPQRRLAAVVWDGHHAIWSRDSVQLYRLQDSTESDNLAREPEGPAILASLRQLLDSAGANPGKQ